MTTKRKMPSLENQRSRDIKECAYGQDVATRKSCFRNPYDTMNRPGYTKVEISKKKSQKKKQKN